ncbi:MAG: PL29 family lyase N-terminal domain-containing protein, partial [Rikenellaceae bacterium]
MKKFFNKFLAVALLSAAVAFVGCKDYDADINDLQGQIDGLQSQIDEINSLIESGSVITNVESISNGIKVTLSNGDSYEITNGTDGTNGTNGTNGSDGADG